MKKIIFSIVMFFSMMISVHAATIEDIDMDIFVDKTGKATITEIWQASVYEGTEGWHPYFNIGESKISVVSASMDGRPYEVVDTWYESDSMQAKAFKAGIYSPEADETDIVFGISEYGSHTYQVVYEITDFVVSLNDADMIYWTLIPYGFSAQPENVTITIKTDDPFANTVDVWGFGKYGAPAYVANGEIVMTTDDSNLLSDEYMTILVKLKKGQFESNSIIDKDFSYYLEMAQEGEKKYQQQEKKSKIMDILKKVLAVLCGLGFFGLFIKLLPHSDEKDYHSIDLGEAVPFRDIPCKKDIFLAYFISQKFKIGKVSKKENLLGALILKWIRDGNVKIEKTVKDRLILADKEESTIVFVSDPKNANAKELQMLEYMKKASKDNRLETNEFKKWAKTNYEKVLNWFGECEKWEEKELIKNKEINVTDQQTKVLKKKYKSYSSQESLIQEAKNLKGFREFLKEFSSIDEKQPIEVKLWQEYLIFAQILGMAEEVMKQFKNLYPEISELMQQAGVDTSTYVFVHDFSSGTYSSASSAKAAAESYSSGGGGFSSGGGGGGSFGGGGGGGGFR